MAFDQVSLSANKEYPVNLIGDELGGRFEADDVGDQAWISNWNCDMLGVDGS
jgi:hypothetical protein